jgi:hypothetical protein
VGFSFFAHSAAGLVAGYRLLRRCFRFYSFAGTSSTFVSFLLLMDSLPYANESGDSSENLACGDTSGGSAKDRGRCQGSGDCGS